jgi:hypothetical protein
MPSPTTFMPTMPMLFLTNRGNSSSSIRGKLKRS